MSNKYTVVRDFQAGDTDIRILVLDREIDYSEPMLRGIAIIDRAEYPFCLNSIRRWATIRSRNSFEGKTVELM